MKRTFILLACVLACTLPGFAQDIQHNGSFESPRVPPGGFTPFTVGDTTSIFGWAVVGTTGKNVFIGSTTLCDPGPPKVCYPAEDGKQFLDLTGAGSNDTEGVETYPPLTTFSGEYYQLSYWVGNVSIGGPYGTSSTVQVYVNGTLLSTDTNSMSSPVDSSGTYYLVWQQFIHVFQAGASTRIKFLNGDPSTDGIKWLGQRCVAPPLYKLQARTKTMCDLRPTEANKRPGRRCQLQRLNYLDKLRIVSLLRDSGWGTRDPCPQSCAQPKKK